ATSGRASRLATRLADVSAPVPVVMGTRLALETSPGRNAVPVRPAQIGAVLAVLGTVAVLVMSAGVSDALAHPERFGDVGQVNAFAGYGGRQFVPDDAIAGLRDLDYISGVWAPLEGNATADGGRLSTIVYSGPGGPKPLSPTLFDGRLPQAPDEVFLAVRTARALSASIGDDVVLTGTNRIPRHLRVTGLGFLPPGPHNGYADGALVTPGGYPTLFARGPHYFHFMMVFATAAGLSDAELAHRLEKDAPFGFVARGTDDARTALREVQRLPIWLAAFLGLLGVGVVGNALVLAVRRRVGELAILRAVGMTGRQSVATVLTQALVLILVGLAFGIPLGLALGRLTWRAIASFIPLQYVAPSWGTALLWVSGTALVLGLVLAVLPARRAARFALAAVLRAE
ncbi:MAG TPA: FtsX-like permease family protein, partial [Nocardioides sp.]|nr:FtsX-like permease family protein [Nocardioides sp.]